MNNVSPLVHVCFCMNCITPALLAVNSLTEYFQRISSGNIDFILNLEGLVLKLMEFEVFSALPTRNTLPGNFVCITRLCAVTLDGRTSNELTDSRIVLYCSVDVCG